jgi:methylenetetrahydrofolate dehydrogenase (NADP+)/methenyltetrahydrofolate cyclohydrolase
MVKIIDGKAMAMGIRKEVADKVAELKNKTGIEPKLTVVLIGEDPASTIYVKNKEKACIETGIKAETLRFPAEIKEEEVVEAVKGINQQKNTHGILVQLPVPKHISEEKIIEAISPEKDVDGLHPINLGMLLKGGQPWFVSCTPLGIMEMVLSTGIEIRGKEAVVVGRSNMVGKPTALLLLARHATVTICHSRTADLKGACKRADILVGAVGRPELIKGDWIKKGAVVIDVGINRGEKGMVGDVDFKKAKEVAGYISPVPGGVGPMTIAMLLKNTFTSAARFAGYHLG